MCSASLSVASLCIYVHLFPKQHLLKKAFGLHTLEPGPKTAPGCAPQKVSILWQPGTFGFLAISIGSVSISFNLLFQKFELFFIGSV